MAARSIQIAEATRRRHAPRAATSAAVTAGDNASAEVPSPAASASRARAAIDVPETYASRQPDRPQPGQGRPSHTVTCPSSAPFPREPR